MPSTSSSGAGERARSWVTTELERETRWGAEKRKLSALVATVSIGAPRRFLLRNQRGGPSTSLMLGGGDLLVMGGSCQRTWQHAIPKVARADPRIAIMLRPAWIATRE